MSTSSTSVPSKPSPKRKRKKTCAQCAMHGLKENLKGHKRYCKYLDCYCVRCELIRRRRTILAKQVKIRRDQEEDQRTGRLVLVDISSVRSTKSPTVAATEPKPGTSGWTGASSHSEDSVLSQPGPSNWTSGSSNSSIRSCDSVPVTPLLGQPGTSGWSSSSSHSDDSAQGPSSWTCGSSKSSIFSRNRLSCDSVPALPQLSQPGTSGWSSSSSHSDDSVPAHSSSSTPELPTEVITYEKVLHSLRTLLEKMQLSSDYEVLLYPILKENNFNAEVTWAKIVEAQRRSLEMHEIPTPTLHSPLAVHPMPRFSTYAYGPFW